MAAVRHPQFCALARAAELLGERWTLLVVRELLLGPRRFGDLRERLDAVSTSVLAARLAAMERNGLVGRRVLPPPAASTVYELTAAGRALEPVVHALIRWGARLLATPRPRERFEPDWLRLALVACARRGPTPAVTVRLRIRDGRREAVLRVAGGPKGTMIADAAGPADVSVALEARTVLGLMSGAIEPRAAIRDGRARFEEGDPAALEAFSRLFDAPEGA